MELSSGFLSTASSELLSILKAISVEVKLEAHQTLFNEHDPGDALYVVREGAVEISILAEDGRKLGLEIMRAGAVFGEIALFDPGPRTATATSLTATRLTLIRNEDLMRETSGSPELSLELLRLAGVRMRLMNQQLHEYVFLPLPARLARKILHLTTGAGEERTFALSQTDLADFTGATREAVSKTLSNWKAQGLIETGRGRITLLDRTALRRLAGLEDL
ncbi:MAG: Crp/Fnr family transcriptional regulator [Sulfitobacter sp.]|nr:Crp/Fnr family transcriptional regulator [Sulfitobacter sp.]